MERPKNLDDLFIEWFTPEYLKSRPPGQVETVINNLKLLESSHEPIPPEWLALGNVLRKIGVLKKKLVEESRELTDAPKEELLNELADVLELTKSIASHYKIQFSKVEKFQEEKRKKRGGFKKKLFLIWSTGKAGK